MYHLDQPKHLLTDWPEPPSLQMGQLVGVGPQRQHADSLDNSEVHPDDCHGVDRESQFADDSPPEVQAVG